MISPAAAVVVVVVVVGHLDLKINLVYNVR
jgi:hypothetical protein